MERLYSDFDFEHLTEIYSKHNWLRLQTNHKGFEDLWFDFKKNSDKLILKELINHFTYLTQEDAESLIEKRLNYCIEEWKLKPSNTLFIGFQDHKFIDGSSILLNYFKAVLAKREEKWEEFNFLPEFGYGLGRIKEDGFIRFGLELSKIVLVDDFVGTGGTAIKRIDRTLEAIKAKDIDITVFSLAGMEAGKELIEKKKINSEFCITLKKGTELAFDISEIENVQENLQKMEIILFEGSEKMKLSDYTLGYGKSEALYSYNRFNMPNNNYPIFWWHRYADGSKRKTMFNRLQ